MQDAPATKKDIQRLEGRIERLEGRFDPVDTKIGGLDTKIGGLDTKIGGLDAKIGGLDAKIESLDMKLVTIDTQTHRMAAEIVRTNERMDRMEEGLRHEMRQLNSQVLSALDASVGRMETLWRESALIPRVLDEHGARLRDHEARLGRLESPGRP